MIYTDSRYATGNIFVSYSARDSSNHVTVFRTFPKDRAKYTLYMWREQDRIDLISAKFLGDASLWWRIMDYNPEFLNPIDIPVGTTIRIPSGK